MPRTAGLTPAQRKQRARIGAESLHSKYDSRELSRAGRTAFLAKFEDEVDPDRVLSDAERKRRAKHALRAHMARLALKSARARRTRAATRSAPATGTGAETCLPADGRRPEGAQLD